MDSSARHLRSIDRTLRSVAISVLAIFIVWMLGDVLLLFFAAVLIACGIRAAGNRISRTMGLEARSSVLLTWILIILSVSLLIWWRGSVLADQVTQVFNQLAGQIEHVWNRLGDSSWGSHILQHLRDNLESVGTKMSGYVPGIAVSILGLGGSFLLIIAVSAFLALSPQVYLEGFLRILPSSHRRQARRIAEQISETLQSWLLGQIADMAIVASLIGLGLFILGVPLAATLAPIAGLLNFIPYVGAIAGAVPSILVALAVSPTLALWVTLLFCCVQVLEGNVTLPLIQKHMVALPPALTILAQTILGSRARVM